MYTETTVNWSVSNSSTIASSNSVFSFENVAECIVVLWFKFVWAFSNHSYHSAL